MGGVNVSYLDALHSKEFITATQREWGLSEEDIETLLRRQGDELRSRLPMGERGNHFHRAGRIFRQSNDRLNP